MFPRRRWPAFAAMGLLLSTQSCITEPEIATGTGSYQLNGVVKRCDVQSNVTYPVVNNQTHDKLDIILITTPEPPTGPESVILAFTKARAQPTTAYQLTDLRYQTASGVTATYPHHTVRLHEAKGNYTGTFTGTSTTGLTPTQFELTNGTFAGVRPGD